MPEITDITRQMEEVQRRFDTEMSALRNQLPEQTTYAASIPQLRAILPLVRAGRKLDAIKLLRAMTDSGPLGKGSLTLHDAKDWCDFLEEVSNA